MALTSGEIEVMQVLWEHGEQKPGDIQERFPRPIKNAALRFQLKTLLDKGHVSRRKVGKAYFYKAVTQRENAFKKMTRRLAEAFCQGSAAGLVAELIKNEDFSPEEIEELKKLAATKAPKKSRRKKGR
ncbi:MAG: BlaI/MecI/CopY family transcriptional regulator [Candidatus Omnitrophica bacterium]|nr:BlaI/MecI/CopY family transcriptional regulator [Candidatus Omnitrophota bacterium]